MPKKECSPLKPSPAACLPALLINLIALLQACPRH
jgi:hypothetical protein